MGGIAFDLYRHKCKTCGKDFYGGIEWAYPAQELKGKKMLIRYFCSWKCLRKYQKEKRAD